jgi:hypothetical protein
VTSAVRRLVDATAERGGVHRVRRTRVEREHEAVRASRPSPEPIPQPRSADSPIASPPHTAPCTIPRVARLDGSELDSVLRSSVLSASASVRLPIGGGSVVGSTPAGATDRTDGKGSPLLPSLWGGGARLPSPCGPNERVPRPSEGCDPGPPPTGTRTQTVRSYEKPLQRKGLPRSNDGRIAACASSLAHASSEPRGSPCPLACAGARRPTRMLLRGCSHRRDPRGLFRARR